MWPFELRKVAGPEFKIQGAHYVHRRRVIALDHGTTFPGAKGQARGDTLRVRSSQDIMTFLAPDRES